LVDNIQEMLVLAINCQTSGSSVENSHLLEIGWLPIRAADAENTDGHVPTVQLIRPPDNWQLPARIANLTGIDGRQLKNGLTPTRAWQELLEVAHRLAARNNLPRCPAVIHFARFEMGFIQKLAAQYGAGCQIPIEAICTHQIAARLLPTLPRKGL
jgi:DNA polymerase III epsilon subunit-like protein